MKSRTTITAIALVAQALAFSATPVYANVGTTGQTPQDVCDAVVRPNYNSGFRAVPVNISNGLVSHSEDRTILSQTPSGDPTYSGFIFDNLHVVGASLKIYADTTATLATYPGSDILYNNHTIDTYKTTFDCEVSKPGPNGHIVVPPGLQSYGNEGAAYTVETNDQDNEHSNAPFAVPGTYPQEDAAVCLNTGGAGGTWTQLNGYTGECSDTLFLSLGGSFGSGGGTGDSGHGTGN